MRASTANRQAKMKRAVLRGVEYARKRVTQHREDGSVPFVPGPVDVLYDHRLSDGAKVLFLHYRDRQGQNGCSWASQGSVAGAVGWRSEKPVRAKNAELVACGYITTTTCDSCDLHPSSSRVHVTVVAPATAAMLAGLDVTTNDVTVELVALETVEAEGGDDSTGIPFSEGGDDSAGIPSRGDEVMGDLTGDDSTGITGDDSQGVMGDDSTGIHNENQLNDNQFNENHSPPVLTSEEFSPSPASPDSENSPSFGGGSGGNPTTHPANGPLVEVRPASPDPPPPTSTFVIDAEFCAEFADCEDCDPHAYARDDSMRGELILWAIALGVVRPGGSGGLVYRSRTFDDPSDMFQTFVPAFVPLGSQMEVVEWLGLADDVFNAQSRFEREQRAKRRAT